MATYEGYITTSASTTSTSWSTTANYVSYSDVEMSRDNMAFNKKTKKKQSKKKNEFKSEIMSWAVKELGLDSGNITLLFHSPMHTTRNSMLLKDFNLLADIGYTVRSIPTRDHRVYDPFDSPGLISRVFVDGVLEHMPGIMSQALFLKKLMTLLYRDRSSYLILHTKTRKQIHEEAKRNNYPKDERGYLVTLPGGMQSRIEGINDDEVKALIAYGRIGSIWKSDTLSKVNGSHIILWNGV
jgi:hypothetical protein